MDGNRRWARERGLPVSAGHRAGLRALERLLPVVRDRGIGTLTVFGFSSANWHREKKEVSYLMRLAEEALAEFTPRCVAEGVRLEIIGRTDRLPRRLSKCIADSEATTAAGARRLRIALDYSSREAIVQAARSLGADIDAEALDERLGGHVDLLIRPGREQRLSDFLLWECAFAELYFPDLYWPEFDERALAEALDWFAARQRRFGR
jgi:undecaprenyl diphosphate synthase